MHLLSKAHLQHVILKHFLIDLSKYRYNGDMFLNKDRTYDSDSAYKKRGTLDLQIFHGHSVDKIYFSCIIIIHKSTNVAVLEDLIHYTCIFLFVKR